MESVIDKISAAQRKPKVVDVKSGDTVKVHQKIKEGNKERVQIFQGLVIKVSGRSTHLARITVRRIASGIGVEKSFLINSPLVVRLEVVRRGKVRRNYLSYMRNLTGKSARLNSVDFDRKLVNDIGEEEVKTEKESAKKEEAESEQATKDESAQDEADNKTETKAAEKEDTQSDSDNQEEAKAA